MYLVKYTIFSTTAANLVPGPLNSHALRVAIRELSTCLNTIRWQQEMATQTDPRVFSNMSTEFYLRYYVGHKGKFGHEFLEFEFRPDGEYLC